MVREYRQLNIYFVLVNFLARLRPCMVQKFTDTEEYADECVFFWTISLSEYLSRSHQI